MAGDYGNGTYTETQRVRSSGATVRARASEMADELKDMGTAFTDAESVWSAQSFDNLKATFANFETIFKSYSTMFDELGDGIQQAAASFEATEEDNAALASRSNLG